MSRVDDRVPTVYRVTDEKKILCMWVQPLSSQESLSLSLEEAQEALVSLLDSRAKGILENVKADAIDGRDGRILTAAERLLK